MHFSYIDSIYNLIILGVHVFVELTAAVLIYIKHHEPHNRSWRYIFAFFIISTLASVGEIIMMTHNTVPLDYYKLLHPPIIIPGFYIYMLLLCYIIEIINPRWLNIKRAAVIFLPSVALALYVMYYVYIGEITNIYSISRLTTEITTPNVLARILFISMYIPYAIMMIVMWFKWKKPRIQKYIDVLVLFVVLMGASYIFSRGLQTFEGYIIHELLYLLLTITIIYTEHYERLHIPLESVRTYYQQSDILDNTMITVNVVAHNLRELMNDPNIWQDPELTADKVVKLVGTNRTYIQHAARLLGFDNLSDMVHRRRIDYICECLRRDPNANIQDLFWDAGYRSRATAWRHFTQIVGRTPTEFIARNTTPPRQSDINN